MVYAGWDDAKRSYRGRCSSFGRGARASRRGFFLADLGAHQAGNRGPHVVWEIDQLGDGVSGFQLGDCVADLTVVGSNAAYRTLRADRLTRVPAGLDVVEAATLILSWTTAYQLLHRAARVQRGPRVLVHGAAGAVGQALLALGRLAGLELWGTARGEHAALIRELGATPIDYQREDFTRILPGRPQQIPHQSATQVRTGRTF
jgi:hypothetical protein